MILGLLNFAMLAFFSCDDDEDNGDDNDAMLEFIYEFESGVDGWEGDFADYPVGEAESYELDFDHAALPEPLDEVEGAVRLSGTNMSDDLFMFMKKEVSGLEPNTVYRVDVSVQFASDVADNMVGVGGSPGESVWIKAGVTAMEPVPEVDDMDYYRMNINKGGQSQGGTDMVVLGDFSNDTDQDIYTLKTVSNDEPLMVTSDNEGKVWLIVGTDSGFEATTTIYYNTIQFTFEKDMQ